MRDKAKLRSLWEVLVLSDVSSDGLVDATLLNTNITNAALTVLKIPRACKRRELMNTARL